MDRRTSLSACRRAVVAGWLISSAARAEAVEKVVLAGTCMPAGASADSVEQMLAAELSPMRVEPLTPTNVSDATAVLGIDQCGTEPSSARISIWKNGDRRERVVLLDDAAKGTESRTLALALAEALRDPARTRPAPPAPLPWLPQPPVETLPLIAEHAPPPSPPPPPSPRTPDAPMRTVPSASLLFRYMPASATPALGLKGELAWNRFATGLMLLGARKTTDLGAVTLFAMAALASFDAVALTETTSLRVGGELGLAIAVGSPNPDADAHTLADVHAALLGGIAQIVRLDERVGLRFFAGGGYASSMNADAEGRRVAGLDGGFVTVEAGVVF